MGEGRSTIWPRVRLLVEGSVSLVFPPHCDICHKPLVDRASPVCVPCIAAMPLVGRDYCRRCGAVQGEYVGVISTCHYCERETKGFGVDQVVAAGMYEQGFDKLVKALKFGRRRALATLASAWLAQLVLDRGVETDIVVAVPLGRERFWRRGFNQAELIARQLAARIGKPYASGVLKRTRETPPQAQQAQEQRAGNVRGAFKTGRRAGMVEDKRVLLVDDVMTTGATLREAALALKRAGAKEIAGAVVAR
ncbi:MAG: ComF family protein [Planctomycetes bacterium]|nr:ComF family protein [Planctomycetota bacterium]NUQ33940.1 ComF family protein [Planctomycetaceae bacterium]